MKTLSLGEPRLTLGLDRYRRVSHDAHRALHGTLPDLGADDLITLTGMGGLRGRGGAGFPFARKFRAVQTSVARRQAGARVVVNATEGEPGSAKDAMLLTRAPHLVLDGAELAARALGAPQVIVGIADRGTRGSDVDPVSESLREAVAERSAVSVVGFRVVRMPHRFVSGQSGALIQGVNGRIPLPPGTPVRASETGVDGLPTLLSNAETYAQLALLASGGADAYASVGTADQPGTVLLTVGGDTVVEAPAGTPLVHVLGVCDAPPAQAVLVGGYHGSWLDPPTVARARLSRSQMSEAGGTLGAGIILPLAEGVCPLGESARVLRYLARESAAQCGPCVRGLPALADAFTALIAGEGDPAAAAAAAGIGDGKGACAHPDGTAVFARSALKVFAEDVSRHALGGSCGRPVRGLLPMPGGKPEPRPRLSIDWSRCDGHGLCAELLPDLIRLDANGYPEDPDLPVPAFREAEADRAVRMCPALALRVKG
ncbi:MULTISPECIES: ferredoxin [unclassified Nocardiopsis]|uniref:ferredoxin n=1 Tax=Nocardiopsis TaxID=2013 RepID=UPI00387B749A